MTTDTGMIMSTPTHTTATHTAILMTTRMSINTIMSMIMPMSTVPTKRAISMNIRPAVTALMSILIPDMKKGLTTTSNDPADLNLCIRVFLFPWRKGDDPAGEIQTGGDGGAKR
jgi:hypothetical protein